MGVAVALGPFVVDGSAFERGGLFADRLLTVDQPDTGVSPDRLEGLRARVADLPQTLPTALASVALGVHPSTRLDATLSGIQRQLLVTRSGVIIAAFLLLVLALAALLQATRLLAERRLTEQSLMRARGSGGGELVRLAMIEGTLLATVTTLAAPPLGRLLYGMIARLPAFTAAGMDRDPGVPPLTWLVAGGTSLLFVAVLVSPLLRPGGTFVEREQQHSRQDRRTSLQTSGVDVALLVLAGLAYWQLRAYRSPLVGSGAASASTQGLAPSSSTQVSCWPRTLTAAAMVGSSTLSDSL